MNGEFRNESESCMQELKRIENWIQINAFHENVRYLIFYSIVRACGFIETNIKNLIFEYISKDCKNETKKFLEKYTIKKSTNPRPEYIIELLGNLSDEWKNQFIKITKHSNDIVNLSSLVSLRNGFSHGNCSVVCSISNVICYFESGINIINIVDSILNNSTSEVQK